MSDYLAVMKGSSNGSLRERAYEYIHRKILSEELAGGSLVSEQLLAREIGMSRTPVREAIRRLVAEGLVEQVARKGTIVLVPERRDIVELYELREALELYAVTKAARAIGPQDRELLERFCDEFLRIIDELKRSGNTTLEGSLMQRFLAADLGFHMVVIRAADNARIMKIVHETHVLTRIFSFRREAHDVALISRAHQFHRAVVRALVEHDGEGAVNAMREHICVSREERLEAFDRWRREGQLGRRIALPASVLDALNRSGLICGDKPERR